MAVKERLDKNVLHSALIRWTEKMGKAARLQADADEAHAQAVEVAGAVLKDSGHATLGDAFADVFDGNIPQPVMDMLNMPLRGGVPADVETA